MEYWYKYRDDLWKKVEIYDHGESQKIRERVPDAERLKSNIRRAQRMIEGYALCNDWAWFGTFTLSPVFYQNRKDLDLFRTDFMQFIRNLRRKHGNVQALLVPELHKKRDGWHMHGLIQGVPEDALRPFTLREKLPNYIRQKVKAGESVFDWPEYRSSFGFVDMEPIRSRDAAARYITKYITKSHDSTARSIKSGNHLYYVTRGLKLYERIFTAENAPGCVPDAFPAHLVAGHSFEFEYGSVQWYELPHHTGMSQMPYDLGISENL